MVTPFVHCRGYAPMEKYTVKIAIGMLPTAKTYYELLLVHNEKCAKFLCWKAWKFEKRFSIRSFCPQLSDFHQFDTMTNTES